MAIALVILVSYLLAKFAAHTFILLCPLKAAGTVSACSPKSFLNGGNDLLVLVISYLHLFSSTSALRVALGT